METYLVALDESTRAAGVLASATELARKTGARLVLFRAIGLPRDLPLEAYAMPPDDVIENLRQRARRDLEERSRALPGSVSFEIRVDVGNPWQAICEAARAQGASLVLLGSHGYAGLDRVLGTTAAKVVNHSDRSVLVVRERPAPP